MHTGVGDILSVGLPAVAIALLVLISMVQLELGAFSRLGGPGKWLLTGALSMGVLAFCLKMAVALAVVTVPERVVMPLVDAPRPPAVPMPALWRPAPMPTPAVNSHLWQALPERAPELADNPTTPAKVALGELLFNETRLSGDGKLSCASCHNLNEKAGGDGRATALGIDGKIGSRNTPTVWNAAFQSVLFWDGRAASLEEQAKGPILNPIEMGLASPSEAERRIASASGYRAAFKAAFGDDTVSFDRIAKAIAAFERTLITADAPYDRFVKGDAGAMSQAQLRGMALFESLGCITCHAGPSFSAASHLVADMPLRIFPANQTSFEEKYRLLEDRNGRRDVWRVPSLRNVALTGPYFHNGAVTDLAEAVRIMASAQLGLALGTAAPRGSYWLTEDKSLHSSERRVLSDREVNDIVAFLRALSSETLAARGGQ